MNKEIIKISFVGDIMCKEKQLKASKINNTYDFTNCFKNMKKYFLKSDYLVGNLETPITNDNNNLTTELFSFSTPIQFLEALKNVGFNLLSTANNHCLDRGKDGLVETINSLDKLNLSHIGTYRNKKEKTNIFVKEIEGIKFAFISYTYGTNANINHQYLKKDDCYMVNLFRKQEITIRKFNIFKRLKRKCFGNRIEDKFNFRRDRKYLVNVIEEIKKAKEVSDYVFFCMHSGGQYNEFPENYTRKLMDFLINNGVDFVIGAHPHVVHGIKRYGNSMGAYSLGNFYAIPYANPNQVDELPDYSIILNFYFDLKTKSTIKKTYSVAKSKIDDTGYTTVNLAKDLYDKEKSQDKKEKILIDALEIVNKFSGNKEKELLEEYNL